MTCHLIVNRGGLLSACPDEATFNTHNFVTDPDVVVVMVVKVADDVQADLWSNRDDVYILADGLPERTEKPGAVWYQVKKGKLVTASKSKCIGKFCG